MTVRLRVNLCTFFIISRQTLLRMRNVSDQTCREYPNTHFIVSDFFLQKLCIYEKMWKNMVQPDRPQMTI